MAQGGADRCIKVLERLWGSSEEPMGRGIRWETSACWHKEYFLTHTDFKKHGLPCKIVSFLSLKILKQKTLDVKFPILKEENRKEGVCVCVCVCVCVRARGQCLEEKDYYKPCLIIPSQCSVRFDA